MGKAIDSVLLFGILLLRLSSVFYVRTFFAPDEYYQALEPAYKALRENEFYETETRNSPVRLTWEWQKSAALRSPLYSIFISFSMVVFGDERLIQFFDRFQECLGITPTFDAAPVISARVLHAFLSFNAELFLYNKLKVNLGVNQAYWFLFLSTTSWFWFYSCSRTLVNTLETIANLYALGLFLESSIKTEKVVKSAVKMRAIKILHFSKPENTRLPDSDDEENLQKDLDILSYDFLTVADYYRYPIYLIPVGVCAIIRPTIVLPWVQIYLFEIAQLYELGTRTRNTLKSPFMPCILHVINSSIAVLLFIGLGVFIDSYFYTKILKISNIYRKYLFRKLSELGLQPLGTSRP